GLMALALGFRYDLVPGVELPGPLAVSWLFALGWAVAKADTTVARLCATLAVVTTVPGFHGHAQREAVIVAGLLLLTWVPTIPSTRLLSRLLGTLAASSLYIYLTHWQVYQRLDGAPLLGVAASLVVGIAYAALARHATALLSGLRSHDLGRRLKDSQQSVPLALSALLVRPRGIKLTRAIGARGGPKDR
ncbi:MAG TPA: hypothetical protein VKG45_07800, partial [Actinomycetes bacterium]|nr:hypothetical protein [Actinomycetes bacterium]